jgi:hypothetical protein
VNGRKGRPVVYTLADPRDGAIRYVGATCLPLRKRLCGHLASPPNGAVARWFAILAAAGLRPVIQEVVDVGSRGCLPEVERDEILYRYECGCPLLNHAHMPEIFLVEKRAIRRNTRIGAVEAAFLMAELNAIECGWEGTLGDAHYESIVLAAERAVVVLRGGTVAA